MNRRQRSGQTCSEGEAMLALMLRAERIPYEREYLAVPGRKFRWDFFVAPDLLVEVQGGVWGGKRTRKNPDGKTGHNSGTGITRDCEKNTLATVHGYRPIIVTTSHVRSGEALAWIKQAMDWRPLQTVDYE